MFEVERAKEADVESVWGIIKACSDQLVTFGHDHWSKYYSRDNIEKKVRGSEVYIKNIDGVPVATITLNTNPVEYYKQKDMESFQNPQAEALYVSALAVLPEYQNRGVAGGMMDFAEAKARENGIGYVRFDCKALYVQLVTFYRKRGYGIVGLILDQRDNNEPYFLMEKKLI